MRKLRTRLNRLFENERGVALVEVLVAAGILGVISLGVMEISKQGAKSNKRITQEMVVNDVVSNVKNILRTKSGCDATFHGVNIGPLVPASAANTPISIASIKDTVGGSTRDVLTVGREYNFGGEFNVGAAKKEGALRLSRIQVANDLRAAAPANSYEVRLFFESKQQDASDGTPYEIRRVVYVNLIDDGNNLLSLTGVNPPDSCYSSDDFYVDQICGNNPYGLGGTIDTSDGFCKDIYVRQRDSAAPFTSFTDPNQQFYGINSRDGLGITIGNFDINQTGAQALNVTNTLTTQLTIGSTAGTNASLDIQNYTFNRLGATGNFSLFSTTFGGDLLNVDSTGNTAVFPGNIQIRNKASSQTLSFPGTVAGRFDFNSTADNPYLFTAPSASTFADVMAGSVTIANGELVIGTSNLILCAEGATPTTCAAGGANIELYNSAAGGNANRSYFDANMHYFRTQAASTTTANLATVEGNLIINRSVSEIGPLGSNVRRAVTKEWVYQTLAGVYAAGLTTADKQQIVTHLFQTSLNSHAQMKADIIASIRINGAATTSYSCPLADSFFDSVTYNGAGRFTFTCSEDIEPAPINCSTDGICANVFADGSLCVNNAANGSNICLSSGSALTPNPGTCGLWGWNQDIAGWKHARCPDVTMMTGASMYYLGPNIDYRIYCCRMMIIRNW